MLKEGDIIIRENGNEEEVVRILKSHAATKDLKTGDVRIMDIRPEYVEFYRVKGHVENDTFLSVSGEVVKLLLEKHCCT